MALWRLRNWARLAFLIYSGVMVFVCGIALAFVWFLLPSLPNVQPPATSFLHVFLVLIYGIPVLIGVWWLILFNRRDMARQFAPEVMMMEDGVTPIPAKPSCPLPIAILAWFQLLSACWMPVLLLLNPSTPVLLFGYAIYGKSAAVIYAFLIVTLLLCSVGLLQLRRWSYPLLIGYYVFYSASALISVINPNSWTVLNGMIGKMQTPGYPGPPITFSHTQYVASSALGLLLLVGILTMVLFYRNAFYEQSDRKKDSTVTSSIYPPAIPPPASQNPAPLG